MSTMRMFDIASAALTGTETPMVQEDGAGQPPRDPSVTTSEEPDDSFPRELLAPAVEGPAIRPKSKPRVVRSDG